MPKKRVKKENSLRFGFLFLGAIIFMILISLTLKGVSILKRSTFDGNHFFSVGIEDGNESEVVSFLPEDNSLGVVKINSNINEVSSLTGIPVLAYVRSYTPRGDPKTDFKNLFWNFGSIKTSLTIIDLLRINLFISTVPEKNIIEKSVLIDDPSSDAKISELFQDKKISSEKLSIEVINATGEQGIAARLGRVIGNMGGDVVLLKNSEKTQIRSEIEFQKEGYTVNRLSEIFNLLKNKRGETGITDVVIILGKDSLESRKF